MLMAQVESRPPATLPALCAPMAVYLMQEGPPSPCVIAQVSRMLHSMRDLITFFAVRYRSG